MTKIRYKNVRNFSDENFVTTLIKNTAVVLRDERSSIQVIILDSSSYKNRQEKARGCSGEGGVEGTG
jgi:hypothetical protein